MVYICKYTSYIIGIFEIPIKYIISALQNKKCYCIRIKQQFFNPINIELIEKKPCFKDSKIFDYMFLCTCCRYQTMIVVTETDEEYARKEVMRRMNKIYMNR